LTPTPRPPPSSPSMVPGQDAAASPPVCRRRRRLNDLQPKAPVLLRPLLKMIFRRSVSQAPCHWSGRWGGNSPGSTPPADGRQGWPPGRCEVLRIGNGREEAEQPLWSFPLRCRGRHRPRSPAQGGAAPVQLTMERYRRPQPHAPESEKGGAGSPEARSLQAPRARPPRCGCRAARALGRPSRAQGMAVAEEGQRGPRRR
jgi:hypothetical protein